MKDISQPLATHTAKSLKSLQTVDQCYLPVDQQRALLYSKSWIHNTLRRLGLHKCFDERVSGLSVQGQGVAQRL